MKKNLYPSDEARKEDHRATVSVNKNGELVFRTVDIIDVKGNTKVNKLVSVKPLDTEKIVSFSEVPYLFRDLRHMNLILTNACNLSCSYCYEQHNKDFGRFTKESLLKAYNWFKDANTAQRKTFQFFGGEPLIHKALIRQFIEENHELLDSNYTPLEGIKISMCSNGILFDDDFIEFYFSKPYTYTMISLDTLDPALDHREITIEQQAKILQTISKIIATVDDPNRLIIRCTLSEETAPKMTEFLDTLYDYGVRNFVVHPLVLDSMRGFIKWEDKNWDGLRNDIFAFLESHDDCVMKFSEGVGIKGDNNCMVGSDMIAIDASGDFSGCYFFTNQKANVAGSTILGNIYNDQVYVDRYKTFQKAYQQMFETEEQCKTCDYQQACYQCPAGNIDTGPRMFRPDDMCQKIVKLYIDFQRDVAKKQFSTRTDRLYNSCVRYGEETVLSETLAAMADRFFGNKRVPEFYIGNKLPSYKSILGNWAANLKSSTFDVYDDSYDEIELDSFFAKINTLADKNTVYPDIENLYIKCFYVQCISILISDESRINEVKLSNLLEI